MLLQVHQHVDKLLGVGRHSDQEMDGGVLLPRTPAKGPIAEINRTKKLDPGNRPGRRFSNRYRLLLTHRSTIVLVGTESCVYSPSWLAITA
jgi:hypothetical protein